MYDDDLAIFAEFTNSELEESLKKLASAGIKFFKANEINCSAEAFEFWADIRKVIKDRKHDTVAARDGW